LIDGLLKRWNRTGPAEMLMRNIQIMNMNMNMDIDECCLKIHPESAWLERLIGDRPIYDCL
jgi:hypothetical protein